MAICLLRVCALLLCWFTTQENLPAILCWWRYVAAINDTKEILQDRCHNFSLKDTFCKYAAVVCFWEVRIDYLTLPLFETDLPRATSCCKALTEFEKQSWVRFSETDDILSDFCPDLILVRNPAADAVSIRSCSSASAASSMHEYS